MLTYSPGISIMAAKGFRLTKREIEIINLLVMGQSRKMIASNLKISVSTVDTHLRNSHIKTNTTNMPELIRFGNEHLHSGRQMRKI